MLVWKTKNARSLLADTTKKFKNRPSYEELLNLVKENGNTGTGKLLGVSESVIRKWLKQYKTKLV